MSNWVSITAADFAQDGWFSSPQFADVHPAFREGADTGEPATPTGPNHHSASTTASDSGSYPDPEAIDPILKLADMDIEGGGDKIAIPIDFEGGGLIPVFEEGGHNLQRSHRNPKTKPYSDRPPTRSRYVLFPPTDEKPRDPRKMVQRAPSSTSSQSSSHVSRAEWVAQQSQDRMQYYQPPRSEVPQDPYWAVQPDNAYAITEAHRSPSPSQQSSFSSRSRVRTAPQLPGQFTPRSHSRTTSVDNASLPSLSHWSSESDHEKSPPKIKSPRKSKNLPMNTFKKFLKGSQPLIEAAKIGDYNEVLRLLAPGAHEHPISTPDKDGLTALHHACRLGYREIAHALILRHANLECRTKSQDRTPLFYAVHAGHTDIVIDLLQNNAKVDSTSKMDGATCLHKASQMGHEDIMRLLIVAGADVNHRDVEGMPPLMWATQGKQVEAARLLVTSGANLEARIRLGANLELSSKEGMTVLQKAVNNGDRRFAQLFLEMGADPNALGPHGLRPLHKAASKGDVVLCRMLVEHCAEVGTRSEDGWTALHFAARYGHKEVVQLLLNKGCEPMVRSSRGETAKELAERYDHFDLF